MAAGGEEHRDRQPRRPGRLDHHLQPGARRRPGQRRLLDLASSPRSGRRARHTLAAPPSSTRTVWALAIPRSIPTSRRSSTLPPWPSWPAAPAAPMGGASRPRSQGADARRRHPLMCCKRARPQRAGPLPSSGASVAGQRRQSDERGSPHQRLPQRKTQRHPRNQPGCSCNPGTTAPIKHRSPLHEESNAPGCDPFFERPVTTGDPEAFVHRVRPSSVSTAPSLCHAQPRIGVTAEAAELGRCGAEHGAGGHCVGAALASHARSHAPAAGSAPRSRSRRCDSPHDPDSTSYREGRATSEAASASVERRSWSSVGFEYEILCSTRHNATF